MDRKISLNEEKSGKLTPITIRKMAADEFVDMWEWMDDWIGEKGASGLWEIAEASRQVCPEMLDMESWLKMKRNGGVK